eukprot:CAMPEP_0172665142 /NCGR_PEP_ID=MMETSP1074-20121228/7056_1 /TAXON_ID=2916 /ORGANISM="Ceratium fusus, Strain PA161109" /LENGTH=73 /DNA_ID=CAMNT_0013481409 /DNA_START=154 /DNA_END=373 /DNA_ORIENTATION=-
MAVPEKLANPKRVKTNSNSQTRGFAWDANFLARWSIKAPVNSMRSLAFCSAAEDDNRTAVNSRLPPNAWWSFS